MKLFNIKREITLSVLLIIGLTGCLKDKNFDNGAIQSVASNGTQRIIEIGVTATSATNFLQIAMNDSNKDTTLTLLPVNLASSGPAPEDINVTLTANPALIGSFNANLHQNGDNSNYEAPPLSVYTVLNTASTNGEGSYIVTIPKGSYTGYLQVKFLPHNFLGFNYAFAFQITGIDKQGYLISSNLSSGIVAIGLKNQWDGIYSIKGSALRAGDPVLSGSFSGLALERALVTSGAASVQFGDYAPWADGSGIGIGYPVLTINTAGSSPYPVTIVSSGGATNNPSYTSVYDATKRTFYISFTWGAGPAARLSTDTLVYSRPR